MTILHSDCGQSTSHNPTPKNWLNQSLHVKIATFEHDVIVGWSNVRHYLSQQQVCRAADVCLECGWADMKEMSPSTTCDHAGFISGGCWALKTILKPIRRQCSLWKQEKKKTFHDSVRKKNTCVASKVWRPGSLYLVFFFSCLGLDTRMPQSPPRHRGGSIALRVGVRKIVLGSYVRSCCKLDEMIDANLINMGRQHEPVSLA